MVTLIAGKFRCTSCMQDAFAPCPCRTTPPKTRLFLDDIRNAPNSEWAVVRSFEEFVAYVEKNGVPDVISFDHDLAFEHYPFCDPDPEEKINYERFKEKTGLHCAQWLIEAGYGIKLWRVHSQNPVGAENIQKYLECTESCGLHEARNVA